MKNNHTLLSDTFVNKIYPAVGYGVISELREGAKCDLRMEPTKVHIEKQVHE